MCQSQSSSLRSKFLPMFATSFPAPPHPYSLLHFHVYLSFLPFINLTLKIKPKIFYTLCSTWNYLCPQTTVYSNFYQNIS